MKQLDFKPFADTMQNELIKKLNDQNLTVVRVNIGLDLLWEEYLQSYPKEVNGIFRERRHYDGNYDKSFVRRLGNLLFINNETLEVSTIWDIEAEGYFQQVCDKMSEYVKFHFSINRFGGYFYTTEKVAGHLASQDNIDPSIIWDHFYIEVPRQYLVPNDEIGGITGNLSTGFSMLYDSLQKFSLESVQIVLELIEQGSLYRGMEMKPAVKSFMEVLQNAPQDNTFLYAIVQAKLNSHVARFKNTAIGSLVEDIQSGMDLEKAVISFEKKVAPENYKRTSSVITKAMIEQAQKKLAELGCEDSIYRRMATIQDIPVEEALYVHQPKEQVLDVFGEMKKDAGSKPKFNKVEEISIQDFVKNVLPTAKSVKAYVESKHIQNLVTLTAPKYPESKNIFKWDNPIGWSYNGEVTDSITARVKEAGGQVDAEFRVSLAWHCADDLDLHMIEADGAHIYYSSYRNKKSPLGGMLDIDMNGIDKKDDENPVENIFYTSVPKDGKYHVYVHNYSTKQRGRSNEFTLQVAFKGELYNFTYPKNVPDGRSVKALDIIINDGQLKEIEVLNPDIISDQVTSQEIWGLKTNSLVEVTRIISSPNYWNENKIGNSHLFFILEGCNSDEPQRGFYNEFLKQEFNENRKVFEVLGSKTRTEVTNNQVAGLGFSETKRAELIVQVEGAMSRYLKIKF